MPEQTIQCASACTVTLQVEVTTPLLNLTAEQGGELAIAVIAVWSVGLLFRELYRAIFVDGSSSTTEKE
ncbi:hypothetical protein ACIGHN_11525 [Acidovorax sp. NPDC077693]|uniref:hypothetical protein n=1 Tax=unclassified Acidovorax TaxID=2684926 RepID=UPI0037C861EA